MQKKFILPGLTASFRRGPMACHSGGATRSKSTSKLIKVTSDVPKAKAIEESPVQTGLKNQV
jgi:hypothetical protein